MIINNKPNNQLFDINNISNKPQIKKFITNNSNTLYKPVTKYKKKIYTKNTILLDPESDSWLIKTQEFVEPTDEIIALSEYAQLYHKNEIDKDTFDTGILNNFEITFNYNTPIHKINDKVQYYNVNKSFRDVTSSNNTFYLAQPNNFQIQIFRESRNKFNISKTGDNIKKELNIDYRFSQPNYFRLYDKLTDRLIGDRKTAKSLGIKSCHTSGVGSDTFYSGAKDRKSHKTNAFNKSIIQPPIKNKFIDGEVLNINGVYIQSNKDYSPEFTSSYNYNQSVSINKNGYMKITLF